MAVIVPSCVRFATTQVRPETGGFIVSAGRLAGKVAIITGGSRGLGQYCAVGYGREGGRVVVAARTEEVKDPNLPGTIHETVKLVEEAGGEAMPVVCNVADADSIKAMVDLVLDKWGQIDVLMNNAAVQPPGGISVIEPRHWELEFKVNVHGPFHCARAVLPSMIERKSGSIINISSVAARGGSHYGATKRALEAFTIGLANEQKANGIAVNALKPVGAIDTPGLRYRGAGTAPVPMRANLPGPENYVEAAILLAIQTPDSCTGKVFDDAEAVAALKR
jgi:citronellol/citronellal dehydrogenase